MMKTRYSTYNRKGIDFIKEENLILDSGLTSISKGGFSEFTRSQTTSSVTEGTALDDIIISK